MDPELPDDFFEPVDLLSGVLPPADFEPADWELADFAFADFALSDLVLPDLGSDFSPLDAFLPAARAAAVVSAADFLVAEAFAGVDFVVLLVVALVAARFVEAFFSEAPDFVLEAVSLVLPFVVVAMVSVV